MIGIGIMSGTSVDAIDAVLLDISWDNCPKLIATRSEAFPAPLRDSILQLSRSGDKGIDLAGRIHSELGELYAAIALNLINERNDLDVGVIGCHGQTIRHCPESEFPFTLQLGNGAIIAQRTGIPTVTDFRSADIALGGQGAPLAPAFHQVVFSSPTISRAIINLGGIANITILPASATTAVIGFDTGPANGLMDTWIDLHQKTPFDEDGRWAQSGIGNKELLVQMLSDPYFDLSPPKSTGREYFDLAWIQKHILDFGSQPKPEDVQQTLAWLTVYSIANQLDKSVDEIYLCGGGVRNSYLRGLLDDICSQKVGVTDDLGFPSPWIEASAFAWMASSTMTRTPCTLPSVTGAARPTIAGAVYYP